MSFITPIEILLERILVLERRITPLARVSNYPTMEYAAALIECDAHESEFFFHLHQAALLQQQLELSRTGLDQARVSELAPWIAYWNKSVTEDDQASHEAISRLGRISQLDQIADHYGELCDWIAVELDVLESGLRGAPRLRPLRAYE